MMDLFKLNAIEAFQGVLATLLTFEFRLSLRGPLLGHMISCYAPLDAHPCLFTLHVTRAKSEILE